MDDPARTKLKQAYELIKLRDFVAARPLVLDAVKQDRDNLDAWWLATFVAETPDQKRRALKNVLRLNPEHTQARTMLERLDEQDAQRPAIYDSAPLLYVPPKPKPRRIRWGVWGLRFFAFLCLNLTGLVLLDNFTGGKILQPIEKLVAGEPPAFGWVRTQGGGEVPEGFLPREERIPITLEQNLNAFGKLEFGVLRQDEAHVYHFQARRGAQLIIAANFTSKGNSEIVSLELWDYLGNPVAEEESFGEMFGQAGEDASLKEQFSGFASLRALQYDIIRDGAYTLAVVNRADGPSGNYNLVVTTVEEGMNDKLLETLGQ